MATIEEQSSPNIDHHEEPRISRRKHPVGKKEPQPPILTVDELNPKDPLHEKVIKDKEHHKISELIRHPPSEPHPLDRRSGTGRGTEMRKNGAGKNNWGTYQDDIKYQVDDDYLSEGIIQNDELPLSEGEEGKITISQMSPRSVRALQKEQAVECKEKEFPKLQ